MKIVIHLVHKYFRGAAHLKLAPDSCELRASWHSLPVATDVAATSDKEMSFVSGKEALNI